MTAREQPTGASLTSPISVGSLITCLNCGGKGWYSEGWSSSKYPRKCLGCNGTGKQAVRP